MSQQLPNSSKLDLAIILAVMLLVVALLFVQESNFDVWLQNHFFDFDSYSWIVDRDEPVARFFFYNFPKLIFGSILAVLFILLLKKNTKDKDKILLVFISVILTTLIVGNIKKFTNIYCPNQLEIYGGSYPYVKPFSPYPIDFVQDKNNRGQCYPAAHAVTGFAFLILCFVFHRRKHRVAAFFLVSLIGWTLGFYQMLKGAHFFSDTLISMICCYLLAAIITKVYYIIRAGL